MGEVTHLRLKIISSYSSILHCASKSEPLFNKIFCVYKRRSHESYAIAIKCVHHIISSNISFNVIMMFTNKVKINIKFLQENKWNGVERFLCKFPMKGWLLSGLKRLLMKINMSSMMEQ